MALHTAVEVIRLPEATDENDTTDETSFVANGAYLAFYEANDFMNHWVENLFYLLSAHDQEAGIQSSVLIIR
jgi:hypothetical protein